MGIIMFNNISSKSIGLEVETFPEYVAPQKIYEVTHIPGRNGDLIRDTKTYENVPRPYKVSIATHDQVVYSTKMAKVVEWLHSASGYARLEDSYDANVYRLAYFKDELSISNLFDAAGKATIKFICKPERYLKSGETPIMFASSGQIQNETINDARPLLNIVTDNTGGTITIGNYSFEVLAGSGTNIIMDCELEDAWYQAENKNNFIVLNGEYPRIEPGLQTISFTGGIVSVEVTPRWWIV